MIKIITGLALAAAFAALPGAGYAAGVATEACAGEAASPYQKGFGKTGKEDFEVDVEAVMSQCESALLMDPDSVEVKTWLARGLFLSDLDSEAYATSRSAAGHAREPAGRDVARAAASRREHRDPAKTFRGRWSFSPSPPMPTSLPAQYYLGGSYDNGYGVTQDHFEAASWYSRAADQNYPKAKAALGSMYMRGEGVSFDEAGGLELLTAAGEMRASRSPTSTSASIYEGTPYITADYVKAAAYFAEGCRARRCLLDGRARLALRSGAGRTAGLRQSVRVDREGRQPRQRPRQVQPRLVLRERHWRCRGRRQRLRGSPERRPSSAVFLPRPMSAGTT